MSSLKYLAVGLVVAVVVAAAAYGLFAPHSRPLAVYVAGAYTAEAQFLAQAFHNSTGVQVTVIPGGSFKLASDIAAGEPASVFMPVAFTQAVDVLGQRNPGWAIGIFTDQMAIVYSNASLQNPSVREALSYYHEAMSTNDSTYWFDFFETITSGSVKLGISNPSTDPEGLYAFLMLEIAGKIYAHNSSYFLDRVIETGANVTRSSTGEYVGPLEEGEVQLVFSYRSYAMAQGFSYLQLPPWLNFGSSQYSSFYSKFSWPVNLEGKDVNVSGSPVYLYITVPTKPQNPQASYAFLRFVLSHVDELERYGLTPAIPAPLFASNNTLPPQISELESSGEVTYAGPLAEL
ncbi:extracellular solute-binding protein [Sulfodiicoccus acidiphilus]|nr:extracellular solute-binding protein [Sulfodiicoccus acidiphilus]